MESMSMKQTDLLDRFRLNGRVVLLTGAAGHLGQAMAAALCEAGATVVLNGRSEEKLEALGRQLSSGGASIITAPFDLNDGANIEALVQQIEKRCGRLDVIVNNAYSGATGSVTEDTVARFDAAYHLTVSIPFRIVQAALPLLEQAGRENSGGASVINIASMYGMVSPNPEVYGDSGQNNPPHYGSAKAGLIQLTRYLACHLAPSGIRVNAISPGPFPNPSVVESNPAFHQALARKVPLGRTGRPDELSGALLFLASDASSFVTGANLPVDGGWTAW